MASLAFPQCARADDWQSVCTFDAANLAFVVSYHAGDLSYDLLVTSSGETELGRGQRIDMSVLQTPTDTILFSKSGADIQVLLRVEKQDSALAKIEIGSGVSWDYQSFSGQCKAI